MVALTYPAILKPETKGEGHVVNFPDVPEALTGGQSLRESLQEAADCLGAALACRMTLHESIPLSSRLKKGQYPIEVPLYLAPKLALYLAMIEQGVDSAGLARRLVCSQAAVRRLLDPQQDSNPEKLQAALEALGKRIRVAVDNAA